MKTPLAIALGFACFCTAPLHAAENAVRAAVVAKATNAEVRATGSIRAAGRQSFEVGEVYEIVATTGRCEELKIDATHVALVPTTVLRIRECTTAELNQAQAKFNVMSHDNQSAARKELSNTKRTAQKNASSGCSTCPTAQAAARAAQAEAEKAYRKQLKDLRLKQQTLANEALDWAEGRVSPSTAAK